MRWQAKDKAILYYVHCCNLIGHITGFTVAIYFIILKDFGAYA